MAENPQEVTYNDKIYTVREFSELIGSNMGWLQDKLKNEIPANTIIDDIRTTKPPTLQRNVKSLSKFSEQTTESIWTRINNQELFGDIKKDLLT